ncbi:MAG: response regulator transcription factor [Actinobacteria bacterium]|nr:response regulator transcription factor [Actinomycetota bacterium]HRY09208.1 response regulator transcription factor [Candidatus Nanopelagicales bacterium]
MNIRVLIVDDDTLVRAGLRMMIESQSDLEVVGEADNGADAVTLARSLTPDIVLMDIRMPGTDGLAATGLITDMSDEIKVMILTTFDLDEYVFEAVRSGASGFLLKRTRPEDLLAGIRTVASGDALLSPSVTRRLMDEFARTSPARARDSHESKLDSLTAREQQVLVHIGQGMSNREIARQLYVSESTVKTHVKRILMKLGLRDRVHAVVFAYENGLLEPRGDAF